MGGRSPEELRIDRGALTLLRRLLGAAAPEEGCALLLGEAATARWRLCRVWPCRNVWDPAAARGHRFAIDPREQLHAQKWARGRGLLLLGSAHSHPRSAPRPSATDLALAFAPTLMLILGRGADAEAEPELACWWLAEAGEAAPPPRRVPWRMEP